MFVRLLALLAAIAALPVASGAEKNGRDASYIASVDSGGVQRVRIVGRDGLLLRVAAPDNQKGE